MGSSLSRLRLMELFWCMLCRWGELVVRLYGLQGLSLVMVLESRTVRVMVHAPAGSGGACLRCGDTVVAVFICKNLVILMASKVVGCDGGAEYGIAYGVLKGWRSWCCFC
ncbi:unnamed protein product [Amaranthus hypochondriacus]